MTEQVAIPISEIGRTMTVKQLADQLNVSTMSIYRYIQQNRLDAIRVGNQWRIPADAVLR